MLLSVVSCRKRKMLLLLLLLRLKTFLTSVTVIASFHLFHALTTLISEVSGERCVLLLGVDSNISAFSKPVLVSARCAFVRGGLAVSKVALFFFQIRWLAYYQARRVEAQSQACAGH